MFSPKKQDTTFNDRDIRAFLEQGCEFEGKLQFSGVVRMNGHFRGEIESADSLILGETAHLEGVVRIGALIIGGRVKGDIFASHRVEILSTGFVEGTISAPSLVTHEGAQVIGQVKIQATQPLAVVPPGKAQAAQGQTTVKN